MTEDAYKRVSTRAKVLNLRAYLDTLTMARRQHALADCAQELADLGIDPATLGAADTEPAARRSVRLRGSGVLL